MIRLYIIFSLQHNEIHFYIITKVMERFLKAEAELGYLETRDREQLRVRKDKMLDNRLRETLYLGLRKSDD